MPNIHAHENGSANSGGMAALLEQMGVTDPRLRTMAELMQKQSSTNSQYQDLETLHEKVKRMRMRYEQFKQEYEILLERNDLLADALGACPICWGEDRGCESCEGAGVPGAYLPERKAFAEYVLPAVRRHQQARHERKDVASHSTKLEISSNANGKHTTGN